MSAPSPVTLAEELLNLVKTVYQPSSSEQPISPWNAFEFKNNIASICDQLKRTVMGAPEFTIQIAESCQESSALRIVSELGVADAIGDESIPLAEISEKVGIDARYLRIAMSCLLSHGYFEEVESADSQLLRNNAMSNIFRSGHPESLKEAIGFICDEGFKSSSYLLEAATMKETAIEPSAPEVKREYTAANLAFNFQGSTFDWMASSKHAWRGKRMGKAMQQLHQMANSNVIHDFDWDNFRSPIVDIGGGIGSLENAFLRAYPASNLNFIIFDIPETIENAKKLWKTDMTAAYDRVSFASGDFLASSSEETGIPRGKSTYLIRHVLHDWEDGEVVAILRNVRAAMVGTDGIGPAAKLLLCEMLLRKASPRFVRTTSMQILALNNGMTRTEQDMIKLVTEAGFTVIKVHNMRSADSIIEAVPVI